jgi:hypothetical protein
MDNLFVAEIIGFIASFCLLLSVSRTKDSELIILQSVSNVFWVAHFYMFDAKVAAFAAILGVLRAFFVFRWNSLLAKHTFTAVFVLFLLYQAIVAPALLSLLPIVAMIIISVGILYRKGNVLSAHLVIGNVIFLVFALLLGSVSASFNYAAMLVILVYRIMKIKRQAVHTA